MGNWLKLLRLASHTVSQVRTNPGSLVQVQRADLPAPSTPGKEQWPAFVFIWIYPTSWGEIRDFTAIQPFHSKSQV